MSARHIHTAPPPAIHDGRSIPFSSVLVASRPGRNSGSRKIQVKLTASTTACTTIAGSVERALHSVAKNDAAAAHDVIAMKGDIQTEVELAEQHQAQRLVADAPNRIAAYSVEMEVIEKLKRIYYFAKRMAKTVEDDEMAAVAQPA